MAQQDPHGSTRLVQTGVALDEATLAIVLVHGRGATAESMLTFAAELPTEGAALIAPQASGMQWYPYPFLAPIADNEPWLSSALQLIGRVVDLVAERGPGRDRTVLIGFSQGACLMLEFVARNPARLGGVAGLSGGLIGPPGTVWNGEGSLEGTPVFLGCGDRDPHIPEARVRETSDVLASMDADVTTRLYPGMGHTVNRDEITELTRMIARAASGT